MIAPNPAPDRLASLEGEVRGLRAEVRDLVTLMDAMREAWLLPPVADLRLERERVESADRVTAASVTLSPSGRAVRSVDADRARVAAVKEGAEAAIRGASIEHCPFGEGEPELRQAWIEGLQRRGGRRGWKAGHVR